MGIASLVLGICSIVFAVFSFGCLYWLSLILGIVGLVLGIVDMKKKKEENLPIGMNKAGITCSIIGICLSILVVIGLVTLVSIGNTMSL